jgi:hypothetical protein
MRAFAFVLLAVAAVNADSDPYTIGQVASGLTHGGVVTGVDYSNGVVSGVGAIGNRAYAGHVGYAGVGHLGYANHVVAAPSAYSYSPAVHAYSTPAYGYARHYGYSGGYGKREAEAEPEADAYTIGQVAAGLPVANAYATGHAHNVGVVTGTTYAHAAPAVAAYTSYAAPAVASYAATYAAPTVAAYAAPTVASYAAPAVAGYTGVVASPAVHTYSTLGHRYAGHYYGKREAEAEPEADAYTIGQVAAGLPVANAYATGYAHALPTYTTRYNSYAAPAYTTGYGYGRLGYAGLGYAARGYTGAFYG